GGSHHASVKKAGKKRTRESLEGDLGRGRGKEGKEESEAREQHEVVGPTILSKKSHRDLNFSNNSSSNDDSSNNSRYTGTGASTSTSTSTSHQSEELDTTPAAAKSSSTTTTTTTTTTTASSGGSGGDAGGAGSKHGKSDSRDRVSGGGKAVRRGSFILDKDARTGSLGA
ncbi:unnamed protein product, partial [Discosporangium mesarthrocarpum]